MRPCSAFPPFSRMLRRRVPVLKLGSRGPGGDARSLRLWTQAFAIVRNRPQAFTEGQTCRRNENRRETQNCRHFLRFVLQKCQQSQGSGGSWTRNAELSSLLDSSYVFASQKYQPSGIGGVVDAKCRTVVTFGLVLRLRVSKVSTVGDRGGRGREMQNCRHFWTRLTSSRLKSINRRGSGGSWTRNAELSSLLDSSYVFASQKYQPSGIGGVVVAKCRTVVTVGLVPGLRILKVSTVTGISGVVDAKCRTVVTFGLVLRLRVSKVSRVGDRGGRGRETQNCRHFWTRPGSSHLKSVNRHGDRGGRGRETQNCRHFWTRLTSSRLKSINRRGSGGSWSRNAELSSLLDSSRVFAS